MRDSLCKDIYEYHKFFFLFYWTSEMYFQKSLWMLHNVYFHFGRKSMTNNNKVSDTSKKLNIKFWPKMKKKVLDRFHE